MSATAERLLQFKSAVPSRWRENAMARLANQEERRMARSLAMKIHNAMERAGLSADALADKLNLNYEDLVPILKGHKLPSKEIETEIRSLLNLV